MRNNYNLSLLLLLAILNTGNEPLYQMPNNVLNNMVLKSVCVFAKRCHNNSLYIVSSVNFLYLTSCVYHVIKRVILLTADTNTQYVVLLETTYTVIHKT